MENDKPPTNNPDKMRGGKNYAWCPTTHDATPYKLTLAGLHRALCKLFGKRHLEVVK